MNLAQVIEALLFSAQKPLTPRELVAAIKGAGAEDELAPNEFAKTTEAEVAAALEQLKIEYLEQQRAFQLAGKGGRLATGERPAVCPLGAATFPGRQTGPPHAARRSRRSRSSPTGNRSRAPMSKPCAAWRSRACLQTLMERGLVKIAGRAEVPGRPLLYETTQFFLEHFGLRNLDELPNSEELKRRELPKGTPARRAGNSRLEKRSQPPGKAIKSGATWSDSFAQPQLDPRWRAATRHPDSERHGHMKNYRRLFRDCDSCRAGRKPPRKMKRSKSGNRSPHSNRCGLPRAVSANSHHDGAGRKITQPEGHSVHANGPEVMRTSSHIDVRIPKSLRTIGPKRRRS